MVKPELCSGLFSLSWPSSLACLGLLYSSAPTEPPEVPSSRSPLWLFHARSWQGSCRGSCPRSTLGNCSGYGDPCRNIWGTWFLVERLLICRDDLDYCTDPGWSLPGWAIEIGFLWQSKHTAILNTNWNKNMSENSMGSDFVVCAAKPHIPQNRISHPISDRY